MSLPVSKRRKVDATNVLFRPFKSPMRTAIPTTASNKQVTAETTLANTETQNIAISATPKWTLPRTTKPEKLDSEQAQELSLLRREESRLLSQLSKTKTELDQAKQARGIEESGRDTELSDLIKLWRSASQQAAEEVYATVRDKVNAVGGMKRWRQMEQERRENAFSNWGVEEDRAKADDDDDDEQNVEDEIVEPDSEANNEDEVAVTEPESFSMDVMLQYLNIDLEVIGYDRENQRWVT